MNDGTKVTFALLPPEEQERLYELSVANREHLLDECRERDAFIEELKARVADLTLKLTSATRRDAWERYGDVPPPLPKPGVRPAKVEYEVLCPYCGQMVLHVKDRVGLVDVQSGCEVICPSCGKEVRV